MITLVIYGLIAVALAGSAGYAFIVFSSSARQLTQLQENQVRMETAAASLRASLLALNGNGTLFTPMGSTVTSGGITYTTLPSALGVVSAAPWGQPYEYCPVSQTGTSNPLTVGGSGATVNTAATVQGSTTSYTVSTYSSALTQNLAYVITSPTQVIASGSSQTGYVAFIVSTLGPGQAMPDCSVITVGANGLTVPGGTVTGVTGGFSFMQRVVASSDRTEIYVNPSATGNGTGVDAADGMTSLDAALSLWQALQPRLTDIYLEANVSYSSSNTLNAATVRYAATGEDSSLVIQTNPSELNEARFGGNGIYSTKATVNFSSPLVLNSRTTFQNLMVTIANPTANSPIITAHAPFIFKYGQLATPDGSVGLFDAYNTNLTLTDVSMTDFNLNVVNSTVEFLRESGATLGLNSLSASSSRISFDSSVTSALESWFIGGTVPHTSYMMDLTNSQVTLGNFQANIEVSDYQYPIYLSNSRLTINSNGANNGNSGGTYNFVGSELDIESLGLTPGVSYSPISAYDGSSVAIQGTLYERRAGGGVVPASQYYGTTVSGSSLAVNGILDYIDNGNTFYAMAAIEGTITGIGTIHVPRSNVACVNIVQPNVNGNFVTYPIAFPVSEGGTANTSGYPDFNDVKTGGVPPLFSYTSTNNQAVSTTDTTTASQLVQSQTAQTYPNIIDPYITIPNIPAGGLPNPSYYALDPTTFEAAVRTIVNKDFVQGLHINFSGTCVTP